MASQADWIKSSLEIDVQCATPTLLSLSLRNAFGDDGTDPTAIQQDYLLSGEFGLNKFFATIVAPVIDQMAVTDDYYAAHLHAVKVICHALTLRLERRDQPKPEPEVSNILFRNATC